MKIITDHFTLFAVRTSMLLLIIFLCFSCEQPRSTFFVSPDGNDQNPGSETRPFASLERARDAIRAYKAQHKNLPEEGFTVYLREGSYPLDASFILDAQDSGTEALPVVYRAYQNETARINGGYTLPAASFEKVDDPDVLDRLPKTAHKRVRQLDLKKAGIQNFGNIKISGMGYPDVVTPPELFFNGEALTLARWPNDDYVRVNKVIDSGTMPRAYQDDINPLSREYIPPEERDDPWKGFVIQYDDNRPARWTRADDAWMFGYWYWDWADGIVKIDAIDTLKKQIKTVQPSWYSVRENQRYYVFNLLEELDAPGEWYLDRNKGMLYCYPPSGLEPASIQLSMLDKPLVIMRNAANIRLENLTFEVSRGHGVHILGGENNLVAGCTLRRLGQKAVVIGNENAIDIDDPISGGHNNGVLSCEIYDTGKGGIVVNGGERRTLTAAGNYAENNHIHHYSRIQKTYTEAIQVYGVGNRAAHNHIHDAPHAAIQFRGNDHLIEYNEIHHVNTEADDAGAIYTGRDWTYRGNVLRYNFMHHIGGVDGDIGVFGIYLDDAMSSVEAYGNVFYKVWRAFHIGGGRDHLIANNLIVEGVESIEYDARAYQPKWFAGAMDRESGTLFVRLRKIPYQETPWRTKYPKLVNILEGDPGVPSGSIVEKNVIYKADSIDLADIVWERGTVQDNLHIPADQDPGFTNVAKLNFNLKENAYIFDQLPGFRPIPFENIGLYDDVYRKNSSNSANK